MDKETLVYAIIALVVLVVFIFGMPKLLSATQKGSSKEALECTYLKSVPGLCSAEDKQKLDEAKQKALLEEQQKKYAEINTFLNKFLSTIETCGKDSSKICKCDLDFTGITNYDTFLSKRQDGVYLITPQTGFGKKIEGLNNIFIVKSEYNTETGKYNSYAFSDISDTYKTNSISFITTNNKLNITTGTPPKIIKEFPSIPGNIAIVKQGNQRGLYIKDLSPEITNC